MKKQMDKGKRPESPTHVVVIYGENGSTGEFTPVEYQECRGRLELELVECLLIEADVDFTTHTIH